jgi:hypothetical protein
LVTSLAELVAIREALLAAFDFRNSAFETEKIEAGASYAFCSSHL